MSERLIDRYRSFVRDKYNEGEIVPWWKGHVVDDFCSRRVRVAPLGFNIVYGLLYELWYTLRCFRRSSRRFIRKQYELRGGK
jgi:hypothetical protein